MRRTIFDIISNTPSASRGFWSFLISNFTRIIHDIFQIVVYVAMQFYVLGYLVIFYVYGFFAWLIELLHWLFVFVWPVDINPWGKVDDDVCDSIVADIIMASALVYSTGTITIQRICYFFSFIVTFSYFANATASNEYLLFCCIVLSLFFFYDKIVALVADSITPSTQVLHSTISKKLAIVSDIALYQSELIEAYEQLAYGLEELTVLLTPIATETQEVDFFLFEEALAESLKLSLLSNLHGECISTLYTEFFEESTISADTLEDILNEFEEKN